MYILKLFFYYEYRNEKEYMEADNSAYRINRYGYSYHSWSDELHDLRIGWTDSLVLLMRISGICPLRTVVQVSVLLA